jgi:hypothetical protein
MNQGIVGLLGGGYEIPSFHLIRQILTIHQISNQLLSLLVKMTVSRMMLLGLLMRYKVLSQFISETQTVGEGD